MKSALAKAGVLTEALPYIRTYRGQTVVVKIGGQALDDPAKASIVAEDLALMALVARRLAIRRAERKVVQLKETGNLPDDTVLHYLNRVSDLVFAMARYADEPEPELFEGRN